MMKNLPILIVGLTVLSYWSSVALLVVRSHVRFRTAAGAVPHTRGEQWMWVLWPPTVLAWLVLPWLAITVDSPLPGVASLTGGPWIMAVQWVGAMIAVVAWLSTIPNWWAMGRDWSMAIVPTKRVRLITTGMFAHVRHPIYALSMLLMLGTVMAVCSPAIVMVAVLHCYMLNRKARNEEAHLRRLHGNAYAGYAQQTGRFLPRLGCLGAPTAATAPNDKRRRRAA